MRSKPFCTLFEKEHTIYIPAEFFREKVTNAVAGCCGDSSQQKFIRGIELSPAFSL
jgi:hypothetical protein